MRENAENALQLKTLKNLKKLHTSSVKVGKLDKKIRERFLKKTLENASKSLKKKPQSGFN